MATTTTELESFRQFLDDQIESGHSGLTPEESLQLWQQSRHELADSVAAVRRAIVGLDAGEQGQPLREFISEFRQQQNISADA